MGWVYRQKNHIGGIMVSVLASSVVDNGFGPNLLKLKTIKLICAASLI